MKKLAIFLAIMLIPFSAFALDTISDNDLDSVTGQAGVSIYTNSIQITKTGVTTTYTDNDNRTTSWGSASVNIVDNGSTTQIYFGGYDPLMIDIINMNAMAHAIGSLCGGTLDTLDYGDTAVQITLPDSIKIVNVAGAAKSYYTGAIAPGNELIAVSITGGTTVISHADPGWSQTSALPNTLHGGLAHDDQVKILITAHTDQD